MNSHKSTRRQKTEDRSQKSVLCSLFSVLCSLVLAGCARQQKYETIEQILVPGVTKAEAMQIAEDILAKMHFTIDKADVDSGIITTKPLPGAQFFEFWRSDNVGALAAAEANLHSIRRIAQLNINPQDDKLYISCNVQVQRLSVPNACPERIRGNLLRQTKFEIPTLGGMEWIDLGKDTQLATNILKRIEQQLVPVSQTSHEPRTTRDEE